MAMIVRTWLVAGLLAFTMCVAHSEPVWMDEGAIKATFSGKTIQGQYASGKDFTEAYEATGTIHYREHGVEYRGHWSLQAGTFCTIYHTDPTGGCFRVQQVGDNCYEFHFVARTEEQAANDETGRPAWTARAAVTDRVSTCNEKPVV
jgi:hypothetical protein